MRFFDNASTTKIYPEALEVYDRASNDMYYNPSALYQGGVDAKREIERARRTILKSMGCTSGTLIFTSGATEADNMIFNAFLKRTGKILISAAEHPAVYEYVKANFDGRYEIVNILPNGLVDEEDLKKKLSPDVCLVSIIHVSNETGAINDIKHLVEIVKSYSKDILFHSDGVQAFCKVKVNLPNLGVDAYTISGHKIHGPRGVGALYVRSGVNFRPLLIGGGQEDGKRSGTENTPAILAMAKAVEIGTKNLASNLAHVGKLRERLVSGLSKIDGVIINEVSPYSPYILSVIVRGTRAETILHMLEKYDIYIGNGSACSSRKRGNRVLEAMGFEPILCDGALRISFSSENTLDDVDYLIEKLGVCINAYRAGVSE